MRLKLLYKFGSESELSSWPDSSVGKSIRTEFSGRGFKAHSSQLSIATSKNSSVGNIICINSFHHSVITSARLCFKQMWRLTKTNTEMKRKQ